MQPIKTRKMRGITFVIDKNDANYKLIDEQFDISKKVYQEIFKKLCDMIKNKEIIKFKKYSTVVADGTEVLDTTMRDTEFAYIFSNPKYKFGEKSKTYQKELLRYTIRQIVGYWKRNDPTVKDPITKKETVRMPKCTFKGNTINYSESPSYNNELLKIPFTDDSVKLKVYKIYSKHPIGNMGRLGGNLKIQTNKKGKNILFKAFDEYFEDTAYDPVEFIGFDVNKERQYWLTFNDGSSIIRSNKIEQLLKIKNIFNAIIKPAKKNKKDGNDKNIKMEWVKEQLPELEKFDAYLYKVIKKLYNSKQEYLSINSKKRRPLRYLQKGLLRKINTQLRVIANAIGDNLIDKKMGIAIDNITTGAKNGEFGQNFGRIMVEICEKRDIPFYTIPSPYTTIKCNECGHIDKKNKEDSNHFKCLKCGHKITTHVNAARNIKDAADELYSHGCIFGIQEGRSVIQAISKNKLWQDKINGIKVTKKKAELV
jgi:putative transposase